VGLASATNGLLRRFGFQVCRVRSEDADLAWLAALPIKTFVDIGAHTGEYIDFARDHWPGVTILAFEPLADCYRALERRAAELPELTVYNFAIGDEDSDGHGNPYGDCNADAYPHCNFYTYAHQHARGNADIYPNQHHDVHSYSDSQAIGRDLGEPKSTRQWNRSLPDRPGRNSSG